MRALRVTILIATAALCLAMYDRARAGYLLDDRKWAAHFSLIVVSVAVGLVLWDRRPQSRIGLLMTGRRSPRSSRTCT